MYIYTYVPSSSPIFTTNEEIIIIDNKINIIIINNNDALFEQVFSLQYYQRGLRVACLEHETTFHIGDDVSAYKLNNEDSRYWDATAD